MELLAHLLHADAASPRLTVYNETTGARMDFSGQTLDNWVAKIANMLEEELDLEADSTIAIDLPSSWQAAVVALGALASGPSYSFGESAALADVVFTSPSRYPAAHERQPQADIVLISEDPFGRGVVESGGDLPTGAIDFGPTVPSTAISTLVKPSHCRNSSILLRAPSACYLPAGLIMSLFPAPCSSPSPREVPPSSLPACAQQSGWRKSPPMRK